jgi:hypothetical protein
MRRSKTAGLTERVQIHLPDYVVAKIESDSGNIADAIRGAIKKGIGTRKKYEPKLIHHCESVYVQTQIDRATLTKLRERFTGRGDLKRAVQAMVLDVYG